MALGTFTLTIDADELTTGEGSNRGTLYVRFQGGVDHAVFSGNDLRVLDEFADGKSVSAGYVLTLPTDVPADGDPTESLIGYEVTWSSPTASATALFTARTLGASRLFSSLVNQESIPLARSTENAARAENAADRAEQAAKELETIDVERLAPDALDHRYARNKLFIPATQMVSAIGSPSPVVYGGAAWPVWRLDASTQEAVVCAFQVPTDWATFDVVVHGANIGAGTGNIMLRTLHSVRGAGDDITAGFTTSTTTKTAAAQDIRQAITVRTNLTADSTKTNVVRVMRVADDALDTLGNDWAITAIDVVATKFITYIPTVEPEPQVEGTPDTPNYFTKASNADLGTLRVWQQAPPPSNNTVDAAYDYWPLTDSSSGQNFATSTWSGGNRWSFWWANRRNYDDAWNKKPNLFPAPTIKIGTRECRVTYTTIAKANAATQAQIRHMLGKNSATVAAPWIAAGGVEADLIPDATLRASPATYCTEDFTHGSTTYKVAVDKVLLPAPRFVDGVNTSLAKGVVLDYEVQDGRTVAETTTFIQAIAADLHAEGKELFFYTNPLTAATLPYSGIDSTNIPTIFAASDYLSLFLWSKSREGSIAASYAAQLATLGTLNTAGWAKLVLLFELGNPGTTLDDAQWVHDKLHESGSNHPSKVMFWRNYALQGGDGTRTVNKKISLVCFGELPTV